MRLEGRICDTLKAKMALTSFAKWFSSSNEEVESHIPASSNTDENAPSVDGGVNDENAPPSPQLHFSFTPKAVKVRPRAWQRKPATPFAPRTGSKKIWKRPPLHSLAHNLNTSWNMNGQANDGIMRPVKKIRVINFDGFDKENIRFSTSKWEQEMSPVKTPRRRRPQILADHMRSWDILEDADAFEANSSSSVEEESLPASSDGANDASPDAILHRGVGSDDTLTNGCSSPSVTKQQSDLLSDKVEAASVHTSGEGVDGGDSLTGFEYSVHLEEIPSASDAGDDEHGSSIDEKGSSTRLDALPDLKDNNTGLATSERDEREPGDRLLSKSKYFFTSDGDDTSYLQAFLSRSRAQREAKVQSTEPVDSAAVAVHDEASVHFQSLDEADTKPQDSVSVDSIAPELFDSLDREAEKNTSSTEDQEQSEAQQSSPQRRSTRLPRLPRPQRLTTLPNTISLRRLNGNEFIAMQKIDQSLALKTRANTKRNKGGALDRVQRLIQLQAEQWPPVEERRERRGRGLNWAETIARMQAENGSEVTYVPDPRIEKPEDDKEAENKDREDQPNASEAVEVAEEKPVRRRRKENLGNVNGTPASKKMVDLVLDQDCAADAKNDEIEVPAPTPIKRTRTRTRSQT